MDATTSFIRLEHRPYIFRGYHLELGSPGVVFVLSIDSTINHLGISLDQINAKISVLLALEIEKLDDVKDFPNDLSFQLLKELYSWNSALQKVAGWPNIIVAKRNYFRRIDNTELFSLAIPCADGHQLKVEQTFKWLITLFNKILNNEDMANASEEFKLVMSNLASNVPKNLNTKNFIESAVKLEIPWRFIQQNVIQYGWGSQSHWMDSTFTENTSSLSTKLVRNKFTASAILKSVGIPVPEHFIATNVEGAVKAANKLTYPVVVKPIDQDGGNGVAAGIHDEALLRKMFTVAKEYSNEILIEKHVEGKDYRLQVFKGKLIWVSHRQPGGVTGDGKSTIKQLLEALNNEPLRGEPGSNASYKRIHLDDEVYDLLNEQKVKLSSKPVLGRFIRLRRIANVAFGGRSIPVNLDEIHPDNQKLVELTSKLLRLDMAGVDLIIPDIKQSWLISGAAICEVNAQPQVWSHLTTELLKKIIRGQGRIPVIFVLGTQQHQEWIEQLVASIGQHGYRVGVAEKHRARLGLEVVMHNSQNLLQSAQALQMNKQVDCLLVCADDIELTSLGLPCDKFDMLILLDAPKGNTSNSAWLDFIRLLRRGCTGVTLINQESDEINSLMHSIKNDTVKPLRLDQIHNFVINGFQRNLKKISTS
jgi:cyanophycin synthetase